jgi:DNA-directed RNA polymerase subunit L
MTKEFVEIEIALEDLGLFNSLVAQYGQGDPSKFLHYAIRKIAADKIRQKLQSLQEQARLDMNGRVYTEEQTQEIIQGLNRSNQND